MPPCWTMAEFQGPQVALTWVDFARRKRAESDAMKYWYIQKNIKTNCMANSGFKMFNKDVSVKVV